MNKNDKEWLVRTRTGDILGPFTQHELVEEMQKRTFYPEDEIAPAFGQWVSAQGLSHHDVDEITRTSTRSQTLSRSAASIPSPKSEDPIAAEELTPTPDFLDHSETPREPHGKGAHSHHSSHSHPIRELRLSLRNWAPIVLAVIVLFGLWKFMGELKPSAKMEIDHSTSNMQGGADDTPLLREIYGMIHAGKTQAALKKLTEIHERGSVGDSNNDYLIPYAGLLITEKESETRARKILEQILESPNSKPIMKARAHHWLGYLMLSEDDGDMGESHFLEALELNPKDAATRFNLGRAYLKQEKFAQALDYLQLSELEAPDLWLIHIYKGRARLSLGNLDEARTSFRAAIDKAPDRWMGYVYYALFLTGAHQADEAQSVLKQMLTRDPQFEINSPPPFGFYQEHVNYSEYLAAFLRVMDKGAPETRELGKLYINYLAHGPGGAEAKRLETPTDRGGLPSKVLSLKVLLDKDASPDDLRAAVSRLPANLSTFGYYAYVLRGEALSRLGQDTEANQDYEKALLIEPKAAITHMALATLLKKTQRASDARSEIDHLLTYHPDYIPAIVSSQNF